MIDIISIALLSLILLLTIIREIKPLRWIFQKYPTFMQLVPTWSFFAPIPSNHDFHLLYRGVDADGKTQEWKLVYEIAGSRPWYAFCWNPHKRFLKGLLDLCHDLLRICNHTKNDDQVRTSVPYLQILNYINALQHTRETSRVQFLIMTDSRLHEYSVSFLSEAHPIAVRKA